MPSVAEDVAFGPRNLGLPADEIEARVDQALERVGGLHLKHRRPYRLSGGEKRLAAMAAVLAMSPDILVLDEPSAGLDPKARRTVIDLLASFSHTKIIATHDLDLVLDLCGRAIVLSGGRVLADGPPLDIFRDDGLLADGRLERPLRMQGCPVCGQA
jgi:cobalt/nickel transport system ATP-binding protein